MKLAFPANAGRTGDASARSREDYRNRGKPGPTRRPDVAGKQSVQPCRGVRRDRACHGAARRQASRPILAIRLASLTAIGLGLLGLWYLVDHIHARWEFGTITELFRGHRRGLQSPGHPRRGPLVLDHARGPAKRKRALGSIEELREFIHVIDLTQLYYTPELYKPDEANSQNAWGFDYTYLLFCTQMIGVISNLAALYTRGAAGDSVLRAASDVEMLTNAVTTKLLSKVEIVRRVIGIEIKIGVRTQVVRREMPSGVVFARRKPLMFGQRESSTSSDSRSSPDSSFF